MSAAFQRAVAALRLAALGGRWPGATEADLPSLESMAPGIGKMYRAQVRAVLAAIREPDDAMTEAGAEVILEEPTDWPNAIEVWEAMIDEVLRDA